jgi:nicotinic acid mononucleotide adenylyltransferase/nicotinamide mononucleotide (NMN) deamidase PncC
VQISVIQAIHTANISGVIALTGGGSQALADLLKQPGASSTVLEAIVPYSGNAMVKFLGKAPHQACSALTARQMAMQAWQRAQALSAKQPGTLFGLGLTAALATQPQRRGSDRCYIALQTLTETLELAIDFTLPASTQLRLQQETLCAEQALDLLGHLIGLKTSIQLSKDSNNEYLRSFNRTLGRPDWQSIMLGKKTSSRQVPGPALIFPGAFDPVHNGHRKMKQIAEKHTGMSALFEISVINVDKPPLDYFEMQKRHASLTDLGELVFTSAATFVEKAAIFPKATFIVGTDTIKRIASPIYYQQDAQRRDLAINELVRSGIRFLVFGRSENDHFNTLEDLGLPEALQAICEQIPESRFRDDISSTLIRQDQHKDRAQP